MSIFSNWSYTAKVTFWEPTLDEWGQPSAWTRSVFNSTFMAGGRQGVDSVGEQFNPTFTIFFESEVADAPKTGWRCFIGESFDAEPPTDSQVVRSVMRYDPSTFEEGLPDYKVLTT